MVCQRCGILGDPVRLKWWHKLIPLPTARYYCAGCGRRFLAFFPLEQENQASQASDAGDLTSR